MGWLTAQPKNTPASPVENLDIDLVGSQPQYTQTFSYRFFDGFPAKLVTIRRHSCYFPLDFVGLRGRGVVSFAGRLVAPLAGAASPFASAPLLVTFSVLLLDGGSAVAATVVEAGLVCVRLKRLLV